MTQEPTKKYPGTMELLGRTFVVGSNFAAMVVAGGLLGWGVDYFAKSGPWGIVTGLGVGLVTGLVRFIKDAKAVERGVK
jgi:F0F1-type ATP synthase assembly protein I